MLKHFLFLASSYYQFLDINHFKQIKKVTIFPDDSPILLNMLIFFIYERIMFSFFLFVVFFAQSYFLLSELQILVPAVVLTV
jgi:hypothetical protein